MIHLQILLILLAFLQNFGVVDAIKFRDCWLLFGGVDDVGFTHATNKARLEIYHYLIDKYPNITFESIAYQNTFFMSELEREAIINQSISDRCNFIYGASMGIFNDREVEYATMFPNISFGYFTDIVRVYPDIPPNLIEYGNLNWFDSGFVAGAVAASTSQTCSMFMTAFELSATAWEHTMGFAIGYHWLKPHQEVHIVTMDSYYRPEAEVIAAQQLIEKTGCDVLGRHTDPNDVDKYILTLGGKVLSMARYVDMSTFVGDTAFSSMVLNFFDFLAPSVESAFLGALSGEGGAMYELNKTGKPMQVPIFNFALSPFTSNVDQKLATETEIAAWEHLATGYSACGQKWRINGEELYPMEGSTCHNISKIKPISYIDLPNVTYYDSFEDGGAICGAGRYYVYQDDLSVSCLPCPENTFQADTGRADKECLPCSNGTISAPGSSLCKVYVEKNLKQLGAVRYYGFISAILVVATSAIFAAWVHMHKDSSIVRSSQPLFLYIFCLGTFTMGASIIPLTIDDSIVNNTGCNIACISFPWIIALGFCTTFSALFSKIWRINQIFKAAASFQRVVIREKDVMVPLVVMISLNIFLLLLWTLIDPPTWNRIEISDGFSYGTCWSRTGNASIVLMSLLAVLNLLAVAVANIQAYQTRSLSDEYSESQCIALAMALILQLFVVGIPLAIIVRTDPSAFFFILVSIVFITSMSLLLLIFVPKMIKLAEEQNPNRSFLDVFASLRRSCPARISVKQKTNSNELQVIETGSGKI